eukprot:IDg23715t1
MMDCLMFQIFFVCNCTDLQWYPYWYDEERLSSSVKDSLSDFLISLLLGMPA